ncbi:MAG: threonine synthase, partial [Actinobacteria bacterium]
MSQWKGLLNEFGDWLDLRGVDTPITLMEGNTPLVPAHYLSERLGAEIFKK